jgi:hypothetical protein
MPSDAEHLAAYTENRGLIAPVMAINSRWASVVAFYAAVHLVERLAANDGIHNQRHTGNDSRQIYLAAHPVHSASTVLADLTALRAASEIARYQSVAAFSAAFPGAAVKTQLIDVRLVRIEDYVNQFLTPMAS